MIAQEEVRQLRQALLGTEFLLIGLMVEQRGLAAKALSEFGLDRNRVRGEVQKLLPETNAVCQTEIPFTDRAKNVIERSNEIADEMGDHDVETEHLLLALLEQDDCGGSKALQNCNVDLPALRLNILRLQEKRINKLREAPPSHFKQGDVVLVRFEETDIDGRVHKTRRPMVVISSNENIPRLACLTVVPLTSASRDDEKEALDILLSANSPSGKVGGLKQDSKVSCGFVYSYPKSWIEGKLGKLPKEVTEEICNRVWTLIKPSN